MSLGGGQQQGAPQLQQSNTAGNTSQSGTSTTNTGPWANQQPFLQQGFGNAQNLLQNNSQPLQENPLLLQSIQGMGSATAPSSFGAAGNYYNDVLSGKYLNPNSNPFLAGAEQSAADPLIRQYQTAISPGTASQAAMATRGGSGAAATMRSNDEANLAKGLGDLSNNFYSGAYQQGIGSMNSAAGAQPAYMQSSFLPLQLQNQAGQQQQQFLQAQQQYPWLTAQMYQQLVGGNYGQSGTTTQNQTGTSQGTMFGTGSQGYYSNPFGQAAGGALSGLGVAGQLGWSPFGAAGGAAALGADGLPMAGLGGMTGAAASGAAGGIGGVLAEAAPLALLA